MASNRDLAYLRDRTRELADMVTTTPADHFISDAELDRCINSALRRLYDKLILTRGDSYYADTDSQNTVASTATYALPADFYQLLGVMLYDGSRAVDLGRFEHHDRATLLTAETAGAGSAMGNIRYRLQGGSIELRPKPEAVWLLTLQYIPAFSDLVNPADTFDGVNGWEEWACYTAAIDLLNREESDPSGLLAARAVIDQQIDQLAGQRDAANAPRISDTRGDSWISRRRWTGWGWP